MDSLLDTNIVSQRTKPKPDLQVSQWMSRQETDRLYLSVVSLAEIRYGIERTPIGQRRTGYEGWLRDTVMLTFAGRILAADAHLSDEAGRMLSLMKRAGLEPDLGDALIAATAKVHRLRLATLNRKHFEELGVELVEFG